MAGAKKKTAKGGRKPSVKTALKAASDSASAVDKVVAAAKSVSKTKITSKITKSEQKILSELKELAGFIHDAKAEIAALRPDEVKDQFLPNATDELDAIVEATADATNSIMDACETIEGVMAKLDGDNAGALMNATTSIYEACTFQDITGQRIGKVVTALKDIEERVDRMVEAFGDKMVKPAQADKSKTAKDKKKLTDEDLLEGPQLKGQGRNQSEIDDLLASFD